jgi:iron(III) transport system ATP-binding protein
VAYVTHDQSEALAVSDHIIVMERGRIAQQGTPQALYESPTSEFVAGFMGEARLFTAQADGHGQVTLGPLRFTPHHPVIAGPVRLAVRPEAWRLGPAGSGLAGRLLKSAYLGSGHELTIETDFGPVFVLAHALDVVPVPGQAVGLSLSRNGVSVLLDR